MVGYRVYQLDGAGRISAAEWIEADDESAAVEKARTLVNGSAGLELWAGNRLIAQIAPDGSGQSASPDGFESPEGADR